MHDVEGDEQKARSCISIIEPSMKKMWRQEDASMADNGCTHAMYIFISFSLAPSWFQHARPNIHTNYIKSDNNIAEPSCLLQAVA